MGYPLATDAMRFWTSSSVCRTAFLPDLPPPYTPYSVGPICTGAASVEI